MINIKRSIKHIEIKESSEQIQELMLKEKDVRCKERLQVLYWLKTGQMKTIGEGAKRIGRFRDTVSDWLVKYETGGLEELLTRRAAPGSQSQIHGKVFKALKDRVNSPKGFNSYHDIQLWLKETFNLEVSYNTVFYVCHHKLNTSPKVPRPTNPKQDIEQVEAFKKT